jgi:hypothetical protein
MTFCRSRDSGTVKIVMLHLLSFLSWIFVPGRRDDDVEVLPPSEVLSVLPPESTQYSTLSLHSLRKSTLTELIGDSAGLLEEPALDAPEFDEEPEFASLPLEPLADPLSGEA